MFVEGSWLSKPVKNVLDILPLFEKNTSIHVLDLGCGVGRNAIPIAQKYCKIDCKIDCIDILERAIQGLQQYSEKYNVRSLINGVVMPIEEFQIQRDRYDLILAISSLEHVKSEAVFWKILKEIAEGVCVGGGVCLIINSNIAEVVQVSGVPHEPQFEVNISTDVVTLVALKSERDESSEWKIQIA